MAPSNPYNTVASTFNKSNEKMRSPLSRKDGCWSFPLQDAHYKLALTSNVCARDEFNNAPTAANTRSADSLQSPSNFMTQTKCIAAHNAGDQGENNQKLRMRVQLWEQEPQGQARE